MEGSEGVGALQDGLGGHCALGCPYLAGPGAGSRLHPITTGTSEQSTQTTKLAGPAQNETHWVYLQGDRPVQSRKERSLRHNWSTGNQITTGSQVKSFQSNQELGAGGRQCQPPHRVPGDRESAQPRSAQGSSLGPGQERGQGDDEVEAPTPTLCGRRTEPDPMGSSPGATMLLGPRQSLGLSQQTQGDSLQH